MRAIFAMPAVLVFAGCCHPVPVINEAIPCKPSEKLLKQCELPQEIKEGATYSELIKQAQQDRLNLRRCGVDYATLVETINTCKEKIDRYNEEIRKINAERK